MNKKMKMTVIGGALAAATLLLPGIASASFLVDTGTPNGTGGSPTALSSAQWVAVEFNATAGETITSLSAYLLAQQTGQPGDTFTFDLYSSTNFTGRSTQRTLLDSVTATYNSDGWTTAAVNWSVPATGAYWLALQVGGTTQPTNGLYLPTESSSASGTSPALGFAYLGSNTSSKFVTSGAPTFGAQVSAVPLPAGFWLFASGLLGIGALVVSLRQTRRLGQRLFGPDQSQAAGVIGIHVAA
jgi:hypothetical protein